VHDSALSAVASVIDLVKVSFVFDHDGILKPMTDYSAEDAHVDRH
jgi:hypothetical protein